jgi:hypothetical protein
MAKTLCDGVFEGGGAKGLSWLLSRLRTGRVG